MSSRYEVPVTSGEKRLWFLNDLAPDSCAYNVMLAIWLAGSIDESAVKNAWAMAVARHEVLRSKYSVDASGLRRVVDADAAPPLDLVSVVGDDPEEAMRRASELASRPFDLQNGPLSRAVLINVRPDSALFVLVQHHAITDSASQEELFRELCETSVGEAAEVEFADFAHWEESDEVREEISFQGEFWRSVFPEPRVSTRLPPERERRGPRSFVGATVGRDLDDKELASIARIERESGGGRLAVLAGAVAAVVSRRLDEADLVLLTPVTRRTDPALATLQGFCVNTVPLRVSVSDDLDFVALARQVMQTVADAVDHSIVPFDEIARDLALPADADALPFSEILVVHEPARAFPELHGAEAREVVVDAPGAKAGVTVTLDERRSPAAVTVNYDEQVHTRAGAEALADQFVALLRSAADRPARPLRELALVDDPDHPVPCGWTLGGSVGDPLPVTTMFEDAASRFGDRVAVSYEGRRLTYAELEADSGRLARAIVGETGGAGLVAIQMSRGIDAIVAILAALRAGSGYLPLDTTQPASRITRLLSIASPAALLGGPAGGPARLPQVSADGHGAEDPLPAIDLAQVAYVLFTSGSTGVPKGVAMPHRALANLIRWQLRRSRAGEGTRTLHFAPLIFDVSFQEIFATLASGGELVIATDEERREPDALLARLIEGRVERIFLPYVALRELAHAAVAAQSFPQSLEEVVTAGEQLVVDADLRQFCSRCVCGLTNQYGPTETHVTTALDLDGHPSEWPTLPSIGRPIDGVEATILDSRGYGAPTGVPGELMLGGMCLSDGYLGMPDLTEKKFRRAADDPPHRVYRTGDFARWRADGTIEFLGRRDTQVKVRGFRVELGEIESVAMSLPEVEVAIADVRFGDTLCLWYTASSPLVEADIRSFLQRELPGYAVPTRFSPVTQVPRTASGKVDRKALADPPAARPEAEVGAAAETETEKWLIEQWCGLLELEKLGPTANFFTVGGHSIVAVRLAAAVRAAFRVRLTVRRIFDNPILGDMAAEIDALGDGAAAGTALPGIRRAPRP